MAGQVCKVEVEVDSQVLYLFGANADGWRTQLLLQLWLRRETNSEPYLPLLSLFSPMLNWFGFCPCCGCSVDEFGVCESCLSRYQSGGSVCSEPLRER